MPVPSIVVIIPTRARSELLRRTLESLAACEIPKSLTRVVVAENGGQGGAVELVEEFQSRLPLVYRSSPIANKSRALNEILPEIREDFVILFDDDVRFDPTILSRYAAALQRYQSNTFLCGRVLVDLEVAPPDWLRGYLPPSVIGWDLGDRELVLAGPDGLGANWGLYTSDLRRLGGFSENRGPGTAARGQESEMQQRLLQAGGKGIYLPEAIVWHYVPKQRSSQDWALVRAEQMGFGFGSELKQKPWPTQARRSFQAALGLTFRKLTLPMTNPFLSPPRRFHLNYRLHYNRGFLAGFSKS